MKSKRTLAAFTFVSMLLLTAFVPVSASLEGLDKYTGTYLTEGEDGFQIVVALDGDSLVAAVADGEARALVKQSDTRFNFEGSSDWIEFIMADDDVRGLTLSLDGETYEASKQ